MYLVPLVDSEFHSGEVSDATTVAAELKEETPRQKQHRLQESRERREQERYEEKKKWREEYLECFKGYLDIMKELVKNNK